MENVIFGKVEPSATNSSYGDSELDQFWTKAYEWLELRLGFNSLHLAVGSDSYAIYMTGYHNQWRRPQNGISSNLVLFSFEEVEGVFMDYDRWCKIVGSNDTLEKATLYDEKILFKRSWSTSRWLDVAQNGQIPIQLAARSLYLPAAKRVWVRNKSTQQQLEERGFENVYVKRIPVDIL